ncbi:hypothetical protein [Paenarthrobacter sp. NPDC089316]|uniref:hypothetical protein n=1 Tax=unclassified Paenarthrobacter TaxID=2634190 RepID=UPI00343B9A36
MGEIRADSRLNIVQVSGLAWAATCRKAAQTMLSGEDADPAARQSSLQAQGDISPEIAEELLRAGILDAHGVMSQQWVLAVFLAASAPLKASSVVQFEDTERLEETEQLTGTLLSVHTDIGLAGGRGVGVSYRRRSSHEAGGAPVTEVRNAVEVCFFQEENAWAAISRHFPDPTLIPGSPPNPPQPTAANIGCTIHLDVSAIPSGTAQGSGYVRRHTWGVTDHLYSVEPAHGVEPARGVEPAGGEGPTASLVPVPATDIASEFAWSLLGAREYLASIGAGSVPA